MIPTPDLMLARCHFPVRGLGFGTRTGIWLQGCSIHCPGCIVPETWQARQEHRVGLRRLLANLEPWLAAGDGVTISGGEPFDQPDGLFALLTALRSLGAGDLLVYSGYPWRKLRRVHAPILALCDAVVSEPYRASDHAISPLTGSANQAVHRLTPLARRRYANWREFPATAGVAVEPGAIRLVGVMARHTVAAIARDVTQAGWEARLTHGPL